MPSKQKVVHETKAKREEKAEKGDVKTDERISLKTKADQPFRLNKSKLEVPRQIRELYPENAHFRWVNDEKGRIRDFEDRGWQLVRAPDNFKGESMSSDEGECISIAAGVGQTVNSMRAYLMVVSSEIFEAEQAAKDAHNRRFEDSLRGGRDQSGEQATSGGTYAPYVDGDKRGFSRKSPD